MKIVLVGGHLSPALSVMQALPKDTKILFIGRKYALEGDKALSLEYREINSRKIPFAEVSTGRLQRRFTRHTISSLLKIPYGVIQSFFILRNFKPEVVLSFGGYLSLPVGLSAFFLRIPIVIHEQTLEAGIANRILSFFAKKICISWETSRAFFPSNKTVLTGNPIRKFHPDKFGIKLQIGEKDNKLPTIYITGGSSGSHFINTLIEGCLKELLEKYNIVHQTGDAKEYYDFDRLQKLRDNFSLELKARYTITKFVEPENIGSVIQQAELVVSRAGINTVTELIFFKKPSLLIPLPSSQKNDQLKNALFLKSLGLAEVFYQDALSSKKFLCFTIEMFNNIERYNIRKLVQDDKGNAAQNIIEVINYVHKATSKIF